MFYYTLFSLFVWSLSSHSRIFHSYGDVTIADEGLQILTYARHWWPLSSEASLTCHTYCDKGLPFIMVISEDPWHSQLMPSVWQWSCHYLFLRLRFLLYWCLYFKLVMHYNYTRLVVVELSTITNAYSKFNQSNNRKSKLTSERAFCQTPVCGK